MKKVFVCCFFVMVSLLLVAQAPYIGTQGGDGLGQYGYLEKDAVTFARLERNTYNNIAFLSARWWVSDNSAANGNGKEYLYHVYNGPDWVNGIGWQCGGDNYPSKRTTDFIASDFSPEWQAGSDCYVSVCARYCDDSYAPPSFDGLTTNGATGFNERHFSVLDVDMAAHISTASIINNAGGICQVSNANNVAGSFTIDPGTLTGLSLSTLILQNSGSALESTDIPNDAFHVYYEPANGTEQFGDGNEVYGGSLTGNWDGNSNDNVFASNGLNILLNGKLRIYVLLCSFNSPAALDKVIHLGIVNDGIALSPGLDGFTKMRINAGSISQRDIVLPVRFISFTGLRRQETVQLNWQVASSESIRYFGIEQSYNGRDFMPLGTIAAAGSSSAITTYRFGSQSDAGWFRIVAYDQNGKKYPGTVIFIRSHASPIELLSSIAGSVVRLNYNANQSNWYRLRLLDATGRCLQNKMVLLQKGINEVSLPNAPGNQLLLLQLQATQGPSLVFRLLR